MLVLVLMSMIYVKIKKIITTVGDKRARQRQRREVSYVHDTARFLLYRIKLVFAYMRGSALGLSGRWLCSCPTDASEPSGLGYPDCTVRHGAMLRLLLDYINTSASTKHIPAILGGGVKVKTMWCTTIPFSRSAGDIKVA